MSCAYITIDTWKIYIKTKNANATPHVIATFYDKGLAEDYVNDFITEMNKDKNLRFMCKVYMEYMPESIQV